MKKYKTILSLFIITGLFMCSCISNTFNEEITLKGYSIDQESFVYRYPIKVIHIVDGDTFDADIDMGISIEMKKQRVRLLGCDTFEKFGDTRENGLEATSVAVDFLSTNTLVLHTNGKRDNFGRILGNVQNGSGTFLKDVQKEKGLTTGRFE